MLALKRLLTALLTALFTFLLLATALDWGVIKTVGSPTAVKHLVAESGVYSGVTNNFLDQVKVISTSAGDIPLSDPSVRQAANQTLSPTFIQKNTETAIDSIYAWLDGKTSQPNFNINLSSAKASFAQNLANQAQQRASTLPKCTTTAEAAAFNAYGAACLPPGVTPIQVGQIVEQNVLNSQNFIGQTNFNANNITGSSSNQSVFSDQLKTLPKQYQRAKKTPIILLVLTVLTGLAIVFLYSNRWSGLKHVAIILLVMGVVMMVFAWGLSSANAHVIQPKIKLNNAILQIDVKKLTTDIIQRIDKNYWFFGAAYFVLGLIAILLPRFIHLKPGPAAVAPPVAKVPPAQPKPRKQPPRRISG